MGTIIISYMGSLNKKASGANTFIMVFIGLFWDMAIGDCMAGLYLA